MSRIWQPVPVPVPAVSPSTSTADRHRQGPEGSLTHVVAEADHRRADRRRHRGQAPGRRAAQQEPARSGAARSSPTWSPASPRATEDPRDLRYRLPRRPQGTGSGVLLGFSHPFTVDAPRASVSRSKGRRSSRLGTDKQLVGEVAANIRKLRKPRTRYKAAGHPVRGRAHPPQGRKGR